MERLDRILLARNPGFSRSRIVGLVKGGYVTVNGIVAAKAGAKVSEEDEIVMEVPPPVPAVPEPQDIPIAVVYEDEDIIVIDKQPGLVVHPAPGHDDGTLVNALLFHCPSLRDVGGMSRPGIVHRLDRDTSGLIVAAKTPAAMSALARAFATHDAVEKTYLAVCRGRPELDSGRIENMIGRHPVDRKRMAIVERDGRRAVTNWRVVRPAKEGRFLFECRIETGRTHQIRVHLASIGCPVVGDAVYGKPALDKLLDPPPARQMLHAWRLALWHPTASRRMEFEAPLPDDFDAQL